MRCSECSKPVVPVVAIDIDGTLGDYHGHFIRFAAAYTGNDIPMTYKGDRSFKQWFLEQMVYENEDSWHDIKLAYRQGAQKRSMPVYEHSSMLCRDVREAGAELWLTTTRPFLRLDNVDPDTRAWLERHHIPYDGLLYDEFKNERLAELIDPTRVVAVLDDLPEMWDSAARVFGWRVPILRRTEWNWAIRAEAGAVARDLRTAREMIIHRIRVWRREHDGH